ncbi:MAG: YecA family protein [Gammaproteobacteria bacterium]|nr:YecA family protein [Gammaproteobacteria bacterium]
MMDIQPDIEVLDEALFKVNAMMGAAEAHGVLCGMLCARGSIELSEWIGHVLGEQEEGNVLLHDTVHQLAELHQVTMEKVNDISGGFYMLLPEDDEDLIARTEALANWCQGFVYGLAAGGINDDIKLPGDTQEILMDFVEISRAGHETGDEVAYQPSEEDEQAFVEVVEYVRTGVMLINEELQTMVPSPTIH